MHSISNIFYILRKRYSASDRRKFLLDILDLLQVAGTGYKMSGTPCKEKIFLILKTALQDECAKQIEADYIVTLNTNDFAMSDVPAITPEDFLKIFDK